VGNRTSFFWQGRFGEKPSNLLKHYYAGALRQPIFLEALHAADKAQVVVLADRSWHRRRRCGASPKALDTMEADGIVAARTSNGT
jgi:hypothetical protein